MNAEYTLIDVAVGIVMLVAVLRGLMIGLIRETFSIAALGAAVLAVRYGAAPAGEWLTDVTGGETGPLPPAWMAGTGLAIVASFSVAIIGYAIRRSARRVGLSWADRIGGAALGAAEGAVVALLIVMGASFLIGREHPSVSDSRSLAAYDAVREYLAESGTELPDVAAPGQR